MIGIPTLRLATTAYKANAIACCDGVAIDASIDAAPAKVSNRFLGLKVDSKNPMLTVLPALMESSLDNAFGASPGSSADGLRRHCHTASINSTPAHHQPCPARQCRRFTARRIKAGNQKYDTANKKDAGCPTEQKGRSVIWSRREKYGHDGSNWQWAERNAHSHREGVTYRCK